jgi:hypothetical protein
MSTFNFDEKGNLIEEKMYSNEDTPNSRVIFKYDEKGNVVEEKKTCYISGCYDLIIDGNDFITYQYEFDKKGNWIKRIEFRHQTPFRIVEREIVYYE